MPIAEVIRLKQVDHVKNEKDILMSVKHPFIVHLWVYTNDAALTSQISERRTPAIADWSMTTDHRMINVLSSYHILRTKE